MPLEWNPSYPTGVPWEVEISPEKLAKSHGVPADRGFTVLAATPAGVRKPAVTVLEGRMPGTVRLRFTVPKGTESLSCETGKGKLPLTPSERVDNLFAGSLLKASVNRWEVTNKGKAVSEKDGCVVLSGSRRGTVWASYTVDVPRNLAGQPVFIEIDIENVARLTSGSRICINQLDAAGKVLPEALSDPRWLSHMRPPRKLQRLREEGRIHPKAHRMVFTVCMESLNTEFDEYGLPIGDEAGKLPALRLTKLAVRPAASLPFPKYSDSFFVPGPSGRPGDTAIRLVGDRAFWYATHSHACWSQRKEMTELEDVFYPDRKGTVEAWLKPMWTNGLQRTYDIFTASHRYNANESRNIKPKHDAMTLKYVPAEGVFKFVILDWNGRKFSRSAKCGMAAGAWHHVAVQWDPSGAAELYVDGRRVFSLPLEGFVPWSLKDNKEVAPNARIPLEFYVGANYSTGRIAAGVPGTTPFFVGALDNLRVSSVCRYSGDFRPGTEFRCDPDTRAMFGFDRSFDGVSGGGYGFISGTLFAKEDRVEHLLEIGGRKAYYRPAENLPDNDPSKVFSNLNYRELPSVDDFRCSRRIVKRTFTMHDGDTAEMTCPPGTTPEYVEIANNGTGPLAYPALLNGGEFDPRSFGDLADSLQAKDPSLSDRERANAVFQFVLGASDYFMQHTIKFPEDSDRPEMVVYKALEMLNGYCGFECGPLNNMAANLFACMAGCPASQTAGYGHSFQQVHFDGKNHTYDLSAQKFFPAMDNETSSCLGESEVQPFVYNRIGGNCGSFIRSYSRGYQAQNPSYRSKVAMILNPGERFRVWQANDGHMNDLHIHRWQKGELQERSSYREDYSAQTHARIADPKKNILVRMDRFFPHCLSGFLVFDGRPAASNPAFRDVKYGSFCYRVKSCYPIVHAEYSATAEDGRDVPLDISTDGGKTFRPVKRSLDYEVRARTAYLVRVNAPIAKVKRFSASTEVMVNPRVFTGRVRPGRNELRFRCVDPSRLAFHGNGVKSAEVTVAWREPAGRTEISGGAFTGFIPGLEKHVVFLDASASKTFAVSGFSKAAKVRSTVLPGAAGGGAKRGPGVKLADGRLTLVPARSEPEPSISAVRISDGGAIRDIYVVTSSKIRYMDVSDVTLSGKAEIIPAGRDQIQPTVMFRKKDDRAEFTFRPVPPGRYAVFMLNRFPSAMSGSGDLNSTVFAIDWQGRKAKSCAYSGKGANQGVNFFKARYGELSGRANFKWDYILDGHRYHPYFPRYELKRLEFPVAASNMSFSLHRDYGRGVELGAVLLVSELDREFTCELTKLLCGMNTDPARITDRMRPSGIERTATGVRMLRDGEELWNFEIDTPEGRPFFHPLRLPSGRAFTGLRPKDHIWHLGYWFSWKYVNGVNYWEPADPKRKGTEPEGRTRVLGKTVKCEGGACTVDMDLDYGARADGVTVLTEKRNVTVTAPDGQGGYEITVRHRFTAARDAVLGRTPPKGDPRKGRWSGGYAGPTLRLAEDVAASFSVSGSMGGKNSAEVTGTETGHLVFRDPVSGENVTFSRLKAPPQARFYVWRDKRMVNDSPVYTGEIALRKGETLELAYRLKVSR